MPVHCAQPFSAGLGHACSSSSGRTSAAQRQKVSPRRRLPSPRQQVSGAGTFVLKLSGGVPVWVNLLGNLPFSQNVAIDHLGNCYAVASPDKAVRVLAYSSATGAALWSHAPLLTTNSLLTTTLGIAVDDASAQLILAGGFFESVTFGPNVPAALGRGIFADPGDTSPKSYIAR